jgi:hypothetical protein
MNLNHGLSHCLQNLSLCSDILNVLHSNAEVARGMLMFPLLSLSS